MEHSNPPIALVTGGAVRLGAAISRALAQAGWRLAIHYGHSREPALALAGELPGQTCCFQADLSLPGQAPSLFERIRQQMGPVQALVNNAAIFPEHDRFGQLAADEIATLMQLNLLSPLELIQALAHQPEPPVRAVVNIVDARLQRPGVDHFHYRLAKGGLLQATRDLALELAPRVRVNAVGPGAILPPPGRDAAWLMQQKAGRIPLQRSGTPADIAQTVLHLLHADFITGQVIHVDGGEFLS